MGKPPGLEISTSKYKCTQDSAGEELGTEPPGQERREGVGL